MNEKEPQPLEIIKQITTKTVGGTIIYSKTWRHPQVFSFHDEINALRHKCLGCGFECNRSVNEDGLCLCVCDWQPKNEDL